MSKNYENNVGINVLSLSDPSLYRLLEQSDYGWQEELPDDRVFRHIDARPTRRQRIKQKIKTLFRKRRKYALQPA